MKRILLAALLVVVPQDVPQPRPWQIEDFDKEIGRLHRQITQLNEYIQTLTAKIQELQDENKKLKEKPNATP